MAFSVPLFFVQCFLVTASPFMMLRSLVWLLLVLHLIHATEGMRPLCIHPNPRLAAF